MSAPILKGLAKSLAQHEKLVASAEYQKLTPRERPQSLKELKNADVTEANADHQRRCATKAVEILANMRSRMAGKKAKFLWANYQSILNCCQ